MNDENNILGCFVSTNMGDEQGVLFRTYIWGEMGICETIKKLKYEKYGTDLEKILFQFYVNPIPYELESLKEIENYRKKEKAIGIPIIVNEENFFIKSEVERFDFIKSAILKKFDLLAEVVKKNKLDTNIKSLKTDLKQLFLTSFLNF